MLPRMPRGTRPAARAAYRAICLGNARVSASGSMPVESAKSSPPSSSAILRASARAMASACSRPAADSTSTTNPTLPAAMPRCASRRDTSSDSVRRACGSSTLGTNSARTPGCTAASRSAAVSRGCALTRTRISAPPRAASSADSISARRARGRSPAGTLSSRSRMIASAPRVWAFSMKRPLFAGTNSRERKIKLCAGEPTRMTSRPYNVAIGVTGEPTAPGILRGGAVNRQRKRFWRRISAASSDRYHSSPR